MRHIRECSTSALQMVWRPATDSIKVLKGGSLLAAPHGREPLRESD